VLFSTFVSPRATSPGQSQNRIVPTPSAKEVDLTLVEVQSFAQDSGFTLCGPHAVQQVTDCLHAFEVDLQVVVQSRQLLHTRQLLRLQEMLLVHESDVDQAGLCKKELPFDKVIFTPTEGKKKRPLAVGHVHFLKIFSIALPFASSSTNLSM
jgi:hypothetical protein